MSGTEALWVPAVVGAVTAGGSYAAAKASQPKSVAPPPLSAPKPLPTEDDEARRQARMKAMAQQSETSGRESTMLTRGRLGDDDATTRSSILSMG